MICYRITNLITGKAYVGVTTTSLEQRFAEHCMTAVRDGRYLLHRSMRKHGVENFIIEEVAHAIGPKNALFDLEKDVIAQDKTEQPLGYNMTAGGENPPSQMGKTPWNKGRANTPEEKARMDQTGLERGRGHNRGKKCAPMSACTKSAISKATKGKPKPEGFAEKIKQSWVLRRAAYTAQQ
jgi:group I intron endonuclease